MIAARGQPTWRPRAARAWSRAETTRAVCSDRDTARPRGASPHPLGVTDSDSTSQLRHVFGCGALLSLHDVELDTVALDEASEAPALDGRLMDEAILLSVLTRDEAEPFRIVEPLDGPGGTHCYSCEFAVWVVRGFGTD